MEKPVFKYHDHHDRVDIIMAKKVVQIKSWDMVDESIKFLSLCGKKAIEETIKELKEASKMSNR